MMDKILLVAIISTLGNINAFRVQRQKTFSVSDHGNVRDIEFVPSQVFLVDENGSFCRSGASIINENWVVVEAECVCNGKDPKRLSFTVRNSIGAEYEVDYVVCHPDFKTSRLPTDETKFIYENNIALARVEKRFEFNHIQGPIQLNYKRRPTLVERPVQIATWNDFALIILSKKECDDKLTKLGTELKLQPGQLCINVINSGEFSSVVIAGHATFLNTLVGISSWYICGGNTNNPIGLGFYTDIAYYYDWIESAMKAEATKNFEDPNFRVIRKRQSPSTTKSVYIGDDFELITYEPQQFSLEIRRGIFCRNGGTIIKEHWVLTAAACVCDGQNNSIMTDITVKALNDTVHVLDIVCHPDYGTSLFLTGTRIYKNNIALIRVEKPFNLDNTNNFMKPNFLSRESYVGHFLYSPVWGQYSMKMLSNEECNKKIKNIDTNYAMDDGQLCLKVMINCEYFCVGGNPAITSNSLVGISSSYLSIENNSCDRKGLVLFTDIAYHYDWIERITNKMATNGFQGSSIGMAEKIEVPEISNITVSDPLEAFTYDSSQFSVEIINRISFCRSGGSIIKKRWVLTAATCVCNGLHDFKRTDVIVRSFNETVHVVQKIVCHPGYGTSLFSTGTRAYKDNVALIKVKRQFGFKHIDNFIQPNDKPRESFVGRIVHSPGWSELVMIVLSKQECDNELIKVDDNHKLEPGQLCLKVKYGCNVPCTEGTPAIIKDFLIGISSWYVIKDRDGCDPRGLIFYTDIAYYYQWIKETAV